MGAPQTKKSSALSQTSGELTEPTLEVGPGVKEKRESPSTRQIEAQEYDEILKAAGEGIKPAFMAKVHVLNEAIKEIGMGRFQYELFCTAGKYTPLSTRALF